MTQAYLLDVYLNVCSTAGASPIEQIVELFNTSQVPLESYEQFSTLENEAAFFDRLGKHYAAQPGASDKLNCERALSIAKALQELVKLIPTITETAQRAVEMYTTLKQLKYSRFDYLKAAVAIYVDNSLRKYLYRSLSLNLAQLAKQPVELHMSYLKDAFVLQLCDTEPIYKRLKSVLNIAEVADALFKLTGFQAEDLSPFVFLINENEFEAYYTTLSKSFLAEESKCANIIIGIFQKLQKGSVPMLMQFKGVLRRKGVRNALESIFSQLTTYCKTFIDEVDVLSLKVQQQCRTPMDITTQALCDSLVEIKRCRVCAADYYGVAQLLLCDTAEFDGLRAYFKGVASSLKSRQDELLRVAKYRMDALTGGCKQLRYVLYQTERGEYVATSAHILELAQLYCLLQNMDLLQQLALPNDTVSSVQTGLGCLPYVRYLEDVAQYYNTLTKSVKEYYKPLLLNAATIFEYELRKVAYNSQFTLGASQKDVATVERVRRVTYHIIKVKAQFATKIQVLDAFHSEEETILKRLVNVPLGQKQVWRDAILQMRSRLFEFLKLIPKDQYYSILIYWSCALAHVMGCKYGQALNTDLGQIRSLNPIAVTGQIDLCPSIEEVYNHMYDQLQIISMLPLDRDYYLCDHEKINAIFLKMAELSVNQLPKAFETVSKIVDNLKLLYQFLHNNCAAVALANQRDNKLFAEKLTSYEQCYVVFYQSQIGDSGDQAELFVVSQLPFLQEKTGEKGIYTVIPSGGSISVDIATVVRLLNQKQLALYQIAVGASVFHAESIAAQLADEIGQVFTKVYRGLDGSQSAEEFSELTRYFAAVQTKTDTQLKDMVASIQQFMQLTKQSYFYQDDCPTIYNALKSYEDLREALGNVGQTLERKKSEMQEVFKTQILQDAAPQAARASAMLEGVLQSIVEYCERAVTVRLPPGQEGVNSVFYELGRQNGGLRPHYDKFAKIHQVFNTLYETINRVDQETRVLYGRPYGSLLSTSEHAHVKALLEQTRVALFAAKNNELLLALEYEYEKLVSMDWSILRLKFEQQEAVSSAFEAYNQLEFVEGEFPAEYVDQLKGLRKAQLGYALFMHRSSQSTVAILKLLKSPALQKNHWHEIADKTNIISAIKTFSRSYATNLPDSLDGASLLYIAAANMFSSTAAIFSEAVSSEYKRFIQLIRDIVSRAEGELSVRAAVDEVEYYLKYEAKLPFGLLKLSALSQQEIAGVASFACLPIIAVWKPILTNLTEKKAVLQSVMANPFNKFIKEQIETSAYVIEAMTRLAHVIIALQRQLVVLEPVMARRVLPDYHDKFYYTLRLLGHVMINAIDSAQRGKLSNEENYVVIGLMYLLQSRPPQNIYLRQLKSQFDNSRIGGYAELVLQLETAYTMLYEVYSALRTYLEKKRLSFPRFYFLADYDVLEILANANAYPERTLKPHVKKLFSAIEKLVFSSSSIIGFESSETENVTLKCPIRVEGPPELWLKRLDIAIKETLKNELMTTLKLNYASGDSNKLQESDDFEINHSYYQVKSGKNTAFLPFYALQEAIKAPFGFNYASGEILAITFAVIFTAYVDYSLSTDNPNDYLQKTLAKMQHYLNAFTEKLFAPEISTATYGSSNYVLNLKLKALATDATHYVSVCNKLMESSNRQWDWNHEIKYRIHKDSFDLYMCALDTDLPYTFEYQGLPARLIHTPLTDRCYSALVSALNCSISSNPQGPAGTGKTESVKAFAAKLARPCIVFNCDSAIDRENLSRILIGIVLSGSMGCFDEINRLSPAVLSAVSTDIESIYTAILDKSMGRYSGSLTLADITVPVSKVSAFSAVFVTMNPASREYRGRSELPFSLVKLLRGCFMGKADVSLIMQTILATSGFQYADIWARKLDLSYALAIRRIPKEVHLDWGLRSLQAVLRYSALARASRMRSFVGKQLSADETRVIEREVVIKSLSDATFSRLRNRSADIFKEILTDVFGEQEKLKSNRFGAVSDVEIRLVEAIDTDSDRLGMLTLQLYRALTSKLGVALLGCSASGKTTVWNLLKQAVFKASNGKIAFYEYRIAPKAMSRQDLLGYVDANKEWVDGVLSKSARQAVQQLGQGVWPVLVFDGDIDPLWIESLNSSLDDNRLLSLSSGERIRFPISLDPLETYFTNTSDSIPMPVSFLFETDSLQHASPATVSRLAVILVADAQAEERQGIVSGMHDGLGRAADLLYKLCQSDFASLTTHMHTAGYGEMALNPKFSFAVGALRCIYSECGAIGESEYKYLALQISGGEVPLKQHNIAPQFTEKDDKYTSQQTYAIRLAQAYLQAGASIVIAGPHGSTKYFTITEAAGLRDQYKIITLCCTFLTTREDILRTVMQECVESYRLDGAREIRPAGNKKLLFVLRDTDVVASDEYGHSQIYTMLWAVVNSNMLYLKQGNTVALSGIQFAITVYARSDVPYRLLRKMGFIQLNALKDNEIYYVVREYYKDFLYLTKQKALRYYLQQAIPKAEALKLQAKAENTKFVVAIPDILAHCVVAFTTFRALPNYQKLEGEDLATMLACFLEARVPYYIGKAAAHTDLKIFCNSFGDKVFTVAQMSKTAQAVYRMINQDEPAAIAELELELTTLKVRMNMLSELLGVVTEFYPGISGYKKYLYVLPPEELGPYLSLLSALEMQLFANSGVIVLSYPSNYSFEATVLACLTLALRIKIVGCDNVTSATLRSIGELIARGFRVALIIDSSAIYHDKQWVQVASAFASGDLGYLKSYLALSDLRALVGAYGETEAIGDLSESEQIMCFLKKWTANMYVVLHLNPEFAFVDNIFYWAPAIRRTFGVVAFPIQDYNSPSPQIPFIFRTFTEKPPPMEKQLSQFIKAFYTKYVPNGTAVSNTIYIRSLMLFSILREKWIKLVRERQEQLKEGLYQLGSAQAEVDALAKEAAKSQTAIYQAQEQANKALVEIRTKMEDAQKKKNEANYLQQRLSQEQVVIAEQTKQAEASFAAVMPMIEEATKAVYNIPNDAMTEVKSFKSPPPAVQTVLEAVLTFMGNSDVSWNGMRAFLAQGQVIRQIVSFDVKYVPVQRMNKVIQIVYSNPKAFEYSSIERVSRAAAPLAKWVQASLSYVQVAVYVEPLRKAMDESSRALKQSLAQLEKTNQEVEQLEAETERLRDNFNVKTQELMKCKAELEVIEVKKNRGQAMLQGLTSERERWIVNEKESGEQLKRVNNCALYACGLFVLTGSKTDDIREQLWKDYRYHIFDILAPANFVDECRSHYLRISNQVLENVAVMDVIDQHPGFIGAVLSYVTEQSGVLRYLYSKYQGAYTISAASENLVNLLAIAARFGQKVIVTDCDSGSVPSAVVPYLRYGAVGYQATDSGSGQSGDDQILDFTVIAPETTVTAPISTDKNGEVSPAFRIFLLSSVDLQLPAELNNRVLELSFAPTEQARADLYTDEVLREWSPSTLQKIQDLTKTQAELRGQLLAIELKLLDALYKSKHASNILEDENLMLVLLYANEQSAKIKEAQNDAYKAEQELDKLRYQAMQIAEAVGRASQALDAIANLNDLYITDDSAVIPLLQQALQQFKPINGDITQQHIDQTIAHFFTYIHRRVGAMVFSQDKIGAYAILARYCRPQSFDSKTFSLLAGTWRAESEETVSWAGEKYQTQFKYIAAAFGPETCKKIQFYSPYHWGSFVSKVLAAKNIDGLVPECASTITSFYRLALISAIRFDLLSAGLARACDELMDNPSVPVVSHLDQALRLTTSIAQPIVLYTSGGQDATSSLYGELVALAPGREAEATYRFEKLLSYQSVPSLIIVKGAYLCIDWLAVLPSRLAQFQLQPNCAKTRVILLLEPKSEFPKGLSRISWRICVQQSSSPRETMLGVLSAWPVLEHPIYRFVAYAVSALHAVLEGRLAYQPRGVAKNPGWSATDPLTLISILGRRADSTEPSAEQLIARAHGYILDAVYGVQTRDAADETLIKAMCNVVFSHDFVAFLSKFANYRAHAAYTIAENFLNAQEFSGLIRRADDFPIIKYVTPPFELLRSSDMQKTLEYVGRNFPDAPGPDILVLPPNALFTRGEKDSLLVRSILSRGGVSSVYSQEERAGVYDSVLQLKGAAASVQGSILEAKKRLDASASGCRRTVALIDEIRDQFATLLALIYIIGRDIEDAETASSDFLRAPLETKYKAALLAAYIVPETWCTAIDAPPVSQAPPDAPYLVLLHAGTPDYYITFLQNAACALEDAAKVCAESDAKMVPIAVKIHLFPRPAAFLEAVRRYEGVVRKMELDRVTLFASLRVPRQPCVVIEKGSCRLVGASYGAGFSFTDQQYALPQIALVSEAEGRCVAFYVDAARTTRMPIDNVIFEANEQAYYFVDLYGIYCSLEGR